MMPDPMQKFALWYADAQASETSYPDACALATVDTSESPPRPDVRIVLMKAYDEDGFLFYSNFSSAKGQQLTAVPNAALNFHWKSIERQVRVRGPVERLPEPIADAYFRSRPRESQLSAWASCQSRQLDHRATFEARLAEMGNRFPGDIPRPDFWGGWRLSPLEMEFWEERVGRQHHREYFGRTSVDAPWSTALLYP